MWYFFILLGEGFEKFWIVDSPDATLVQGKNVKAQFIKVDDDDDHDDSDDV